MWSVYYHYCSITYEGISCIIIIYLCLSHAGLVVLLIFVLSLSLISRILHQQPHELLQSTVVVQTLFFVVIFALSMAGIVFTAHLANKKMQYHRCGRFPSIA